MSKLFYYIWNGVNDTHPLMSLGFMNSIKVAVTKGLAEQTAMDIRNYAWKAPTQGQPGNVSVDEAVQRG